MKKLFHKPENIFIIIGLICGLVFLTVNPPFQASDESVHFYRASDIAEGHFIPVKINDKTGVNISMNLEIIAYKYPWNKIDYQKAKYSPNETFSRLNIKHDYRIKHFVNMADVAIINYPPFPYLASAISIDIGKLLNLSPLLIMYLGRLANLLLWIFLTYLAIKITPVHKWVFFMLALMPITVFQAASLSADSFTIGISFLTIAFFLKLSFDDNKDKVSLKDIFILLFLLITLVLSKPFYFLLMLLFFIIPLKKYGNKKRMSLILTSLLLPVVATCFAWYYTVRGFYVPAEPNISINAQMALIFHSPEIFFYALLNTIKIYVPYIIVGFTGQMGWTVFMPLWLVSLYIITLFIVSLLDKGKIKIDLKQKLTFIIILLLVSSAITIIEYIAWTPIGQNRIDGIQGRYFIPVIPLFFLLFYNVHYFKSKDKKSNLKISKYLTHGIVIFVVLFLLIAILTLLKTIYLL
ncbi:DUF2142 domain-containing protein [Methanobacterium sp.]|uniref:DUF2142 domain-containing protein n=1 Tax=Methanobacterium sp. TaxID=2164 RepID=UPI003C77E037